MIRKTLILLTLTLLTACQPAIPSTGTQRPTDSRSYIAAMSAILRANIQVPPAIAANGGLSARTYIAIVVKPNGEEISARIYRSSGIPDIDQIVFSQVTQIVFPPFPSGWGTQPRGFIIPVQIRTN